MLYHTYTLYLWYNMPLNPLQAPIFELRAAPQLWHSFYAGAVELLLKASIKVEGMQKECLILLAFIQSFGELAIGRKGTVESRDLVAE